AIAVGMALAGCGVWSLVAQRLAAMAVKAAMFRWLGRRPAEARFSPSILRAMAPYSLRLLATDLITAVYNNLSQLIIGKVYSATSLGYFSQAQKLKDLPVTSTVQSVQSVTFPALAKIDGQSGKFAESYRQILSITAFVVLPAMTGLIAIAPDMFALLLGEKWLPTVPYFEIICIGGMLYPLSVVAYNVLKVRSDGRIILRLEIFKKIVMTLILAYVFLVSRSMEAVAWGLTVMSGVELTINIAASLRYTTLSAARIAATLLPTLLATGTMFAAVMAMRTETAALTLGLRLMVCIATGVAAYIFAAAVMRSEALREVLNIVKRMISRNQ
ncbi:MAG: oligosaccharide flippase family protein, partial [Alistipes sp.]|nr:oligosaccharide flippase family protein [Alistipes sp.]